MKILLIFRFFHSENLFYYFERKNEKVLTSNIIHFPKFEISASL